MTFFLSVHYCDYSRWNFFGLLKGVKKDRKPMEIAIISEDGRIFRGFFSSISLPWRIMDAPSQQLDLEVRKKDTYIDYDVYDDHETVVADAMAFFKLYGDGPHKVIVADAPLVEFLQRNDLIIESLSFLQREFIRSMPSSHFDIGSPYEYVAFRPDGEDFSMAQKEMMFLSHPDYPTLAGISSTDKAVQLCEVYKLIGKLKKDEWIKGLKEVQE